MCVLAKSSCVDFDFELDVGLVGEGKEGEGSERASADAGLGQGGRPEG